jgi:hypothetical protein
MWLFLVAPMKDMTPTKVSYYVDSASAAWNILKLEEFFLPMDVGVIRGILLCA